MARSLNKAILIGNLGSDPEIRTTGGGTKVAEFSVATNRTWKDKSGQQQEKTEWHRIVAWTVLADIAEQYLKKGDRIYLEGEIQYRSYDDKEGNTKYITEITARELIMLSGRDAPGSGAPSRPRPAATSARPGQKNEPSYDDFSGDFPDDGDDLPF